MSRRYVIELGGREHELGVEPLGGDRFRITRDGRQVVWDARRTGASWSLLPEGGGAAFRVDVDPVGTPSGGVAITCGSIIGAVGSVTDALHRALERSNKATAAGPADVAPFASLVGPWALFVWLRLIVGLVFPLVVSWAAVQTARTRSMESATGLLYINVGTIAAGTILAAGLYFGAGLLV